MPRPRNDNPETKARILAEAEALFAERGLAGTSIREIAERAGVNSALVHYYFETKEGLYRAVFFEVASGLADMASRVAESRGTAPEQLRRYVEEFVRFVVMHPNRPRLVVRELVEDAPTLREAIAAGFQPVHLRVLREILAGGIREGELRAVDEELLPITVIGMVVQFVIARPLIDVAVGRMTFDEAFVSRLASHTADVLLNGVRSWE